MDDNYVLLAAAIVRQAMKDYTAALRQRNYHGIKECERFFLSEWGQALSNNHGEYIIEHCKKTVNKK